jgi:2-C-methyl-D-erythritol 2,4-cyclodiphosphate synthase
MRMRVGCGFDVHALVAGRQLVIGGVRIDHPRGLLAHSDGDVLLHAIADAVLGAAGMGDIGHLFPDADPRWRGADSRALLRQVMVRATAAGWRVENVDCTVIAQVPKIAPHAAAMRAAIAQDLSIDPAAVNIKGKTTERLGFTGRGEGIAAQAVVLLVGD